MTQRLHYLVWIGRRGEGGVEDGEEGADVVLSGHETSRLLRCKEERVQVQGQSKSESLCCYVLSTLLSRLEVGYSQH